MNTAAVNTCGSGFLGVAVPVGVEELGNGHGVNILVGGPFPVGGPSTFHWNGGVVPVGGGAGCESLWCGTRASRQDGPKWNFFGRSCDKYR